MVLKAPRIMGIVNVTPDSFSDGGQFTQPDDAVDHAMALVDEGADVLDIGGESTRPGALPVSVDEELSRVIPVIEALSRKSDCAISVDTRKSAVARAAMEAGAKIWNDVSALGFDLKSLQTAADLECDVILMHAQGDPETMQNEPDYANVVQEVFEFLTARIEIAQMAGIKKERITIDPGIGFGKTLNHNLDLLRNLSTFTALGCPVLLGASRKQFISACDRDGRAVDRVGGSLAAALAGARAGVDIVRVHDVAHTRQAFAVYTAIDTSQESRAH